MPSGVVPPPAPGGCALPLCYSLVAVAAIADTTATEMVGEEDGVDLVRAGRTVLYAHDHPTTGRVVISAPHLVDRRRGIRLGLKHQAGVVQVTASLVHKLATTVCMVRALVSLPTVRTSEAFQPIDNASTTSGSAVLGNLSTPAAFVHKLQSEICGRSNHNMDAPFRLDSPVVGQFSDCDQAPYQE